MKRIYVSREAIDAGELAPGKVLHDEYAPVTFVVEDISASDHSVMVHGKRIQTPSAIGGSATLTDYQSLYIYGENGLWDLTD